jgi:hypothetical protein
MNVQYLADVTDVAYVRRFYGPDGGLADEGTSKGNPRKAGDSSVWTLSTDKISTVQNSAGIWRLEVYLGTNLVLVELFSVGDYLFDVSVTGLPSTLATKVLIDGKEAGSIRGGEKKPSALTVGTHTISVSPLIEVSSNLRYVCEENSLTVSSESSHSFDYHAVGTAQTVSTSRTETVTVQTVTSTRTISGLNRSVGVEVNPNIELLSVVLSMTTWGQQSPAVREILGVKYQDDIEKWFSPFKGHPAVGIAQQLTNQGFTYDAPPNFILHFGPPPKMEKLYPYNDYIVGRAGGQNILDDFAASLREFASDSKFMDFYNAHADLYGKILSTYKDLDMNTLVYTMERFYGEQRRGYHIIVAASSARPGGGYGATILTDKGDINYEIYRASSPLYSTSNLYSLGLHEFSHSFVNQMVGQFPTEVRSLDYLYSPVARQMRDIAYTTFETMLNEATIRAFECLQSTIEFGPSRGTDRMKSEMKQGFYFTDIIYNLLVEYLYGIDNYKTFASYLPTIFAELKKITPEDAQKKVSESLSSPSPSLRSAPMPAATVILVAGSTTPAAKGSTSVRLEMRNTGAIDIYARTIVSTTSNLRLLNETIYETILTRNETQSLNLVAESVGSTGVASVQARIYYSSRMLDDKTCQMEIVNPTTTTSIGSLSTTTTEATIPSALLPDTPLLIITAVGVVLALGFSIALLRRRRRGAFPKEERSGSERSKSTIL